MTKALRGENLRALSMEVVLKWEKERINSDALLSDVLDKYAYLSREERGFLKRLTEGTVENTILLDHIIDQSSKIRTEKLKPVVRVILRQGTYQLYFMDSVPSHAAINEAVKLGRLKHLGNLCGYINAVLRNIDGNRIDIDKIEDISIRYSCPEWITGLLTKEYGREKTEVILKSFIGGRKLFVRVNTTKITRDKLISALMAEGIGVKKAAETEDGLELLDTDGLTGNPEFKRGFFSVQDLSSMSIGGLFEPFKGIKILELCASPGGKACHCAERANGYGTVEARDISEHKLAAIRENIERLGLDNISVKLADARVTDEDSLDSYDVVIADLPCSGLGVMGRKNEIKFRLKSEDIADLAALQRDMLTASHGYVKKGGLLIYSVCTISREETADQAGFISSLGFEMKEEKLFLPSQTGPDGFYYAVFTRK